MSVQSNGFRFSRQEEKVLALSMSGLSDKEIANRMGVGLGTVRTFWKRIRSKAGGSTRAEVISAMSRAAADRELETAHDQNVQLMAEITRRQAAEEESRHRSEEFQRLAESIPSSVFVTQEQRVLYVNNYWLEWSGTGKESTVQNPWAALHPEDAEKVKAMWLEHERLGRAIKLECRLKYRDGSYRWNLVRAVPLSDGRVAGTRWVGSCTDIHGAKLSAIRLQSVLSSVNEILIGVGADGRIRTVSDAAMKALGYTREELVNVPISSLLVDVEHWDTGTHEVRTKTGRQVRLTFKVLTPVGLDESLLVATPAHDAQGSQDGELFEDAFQRARVGVGVVDAKGSLLIANDRFADLLGHQVPALQGQELLSMVTYSDRKRLEAAVSRADMEGDAQAGVTMLHANGAPVPVLIDVSSIREAGELKRRVVTIRRTADTSRRY